MLRRIEALYGQADYAQADDWCRLALHDIFANSGTSNVGKLQRLFTIKKKFVHVLTI